MGRFRRLCSLILVVALAGCAGRSSLAPIAPLTLASAAAGLVPAAHTEAAPEAAGDYGSLNLTIHWPARTFQAYRTAAIPATANSIALSILFQGSPVTPAVVVPRLPGASVATLSVPIRAATNLSVLAKAYRETSPDLLTSAPIAQGTATGLNVVRSKSTPASITMDSLFVPAITQLSTNTGGPGDALTISGTNFGTGSVPIQVWFNQATGSVVRHSDTSLSVTIPAGATTGNVVVVADGIPSTSQATYWVASRIFIDAPRSSWDTSPSNARQVLYGATMQVTATPIWTLQRAEPLEPYGTPPAVVWVSSNAPSGTLGSTGLFTASRTHQPSDIMARLGSVMSVPLTVTPVGVEGLSLNHAELTLNAMPESGDPAPAYVTSGTLVASVSTTAPYSNGVTWRSEDPSRVTVLDGTVRTVRGALEGNVLVWATAADDPNFVASAAIRVTIYGGLNLGIE